jgi:general nucleoside transport system permease protein
MTISGALAGLASFLNIFTVSPNLTFGVDNLPTVGYDAIAVALVAFNNPFGVIGVSVLWGVVQSAGGSAAALFNMPSQLSLLIFGIVVYFAAIAIVFIK